jgi:hypothetical protein
MSSTDTVPLHALIYRTQAEQLAELARLNERSVAAEVRRAVRAHLGRQRAEQGEQ